MSGMINSAISVMKLMPMRIIYSKRITLLKTENQFSDFSKRRVELSLL